jgi:hypothetical protein
VNGYELRLFTAQILLFILKTDGQGDDTMIPINDSDNVEQHTPVESIEVDDERGLSRFCGVWEDARDAEEIIDEIYKERANFRLQEQIFPH